MLQIGMSRVSNAAVEAVASAAVPLGSTRRGFVGVVEALHVEHDLHGLAADEIERRLIELGFIEGGHLEVLHEGMIGNDPIAVRISGITVALRRREAMLILVRPIGEE